MTRELEARNVTPQEDAMLRSAARRGAKIIRPVVAEPLTDEQINSSIESRGIPVEDPEAAIALVRMTEQLHGIGIKGATK